MPTFDAVLGWLSTPLSGSEHPAIAAWTAWHGRAMVAGWSVVLPCGMLVARFFKVLRPADWPATLDNKFWWHAHLTLQTGGIALMTIGLALAFGRGTSTSGLAHLHHLVGWTLITMGWLQVLGGILRGTKGGPTGATLRGDHYDMTARRIAFEYIHKFGGWASLPLIVLTTSIGLVLADAPRWMPILIGGWWILLAGLFYRFQRSGRCIDTYRAIWGPDEIHPGNARLPIGFLIARRDGPSKTNEK